MFTNLSIGDLVIVIATILFSLALHEAMHAFVAHWLGDTTAQDMGRLTLNPLKHIDIFTTVLLPVVLILAHLPPFFIAKPVPFNPSRVRYGEYGAALIGIAGPLTNFVLAFLAAMVVRIFAIGSATSAYNAILLFIEVNIAFFIFNMIPIPPLDGSRLLYAFAPEPLQKVMHQIESAGFVTIIIFMLLLVPLLSPGIISIENHILQLLLG